VPIEEEGIVSLIVRTIYRCITVVWKHQYLRYKTKDAWQSGKKNLKKWGAEILQVV
jgi:hypothetical protein